MVAYALVTNPFLYQMHIKIHSQLTFNKKCIMEKLSAFVSTLQNDDASFSLECNALCNNNLVSCVLMDERRPGPGG